MRRVWTFSIAGLLLLVLAAAYMRVSTKTASADGPAATTVDVAMGDTTTLTSYYATSANYNPYYNYYNYYHSYYNSYYYPNYYATTYYPYTSYTNPYYYPYSSYYNNYYYGGSWQYCTIPGSGAVWIAPGAATTGMVCN